MTPKPRIPEACAAPRQTTAPRKPRGIVVARATDFFAATRAVLTRCAGDARARDDFGERRDERENLVARRRERDGHAHRARRVGPRPAAGDEHLGRKSGAAPP